MLVGGLAVASCFCPALAPIAIAAFTGYVSGLAISVGTSLVTSTIQNGFGNYDWNAIAKQANKDAFWGAFSGAAFAGGGAAASNVLSKAGPKAAKSIRDVASYTNKVDDYIDDAANLADDVVRGENSSAFFDAFNAADNYNLSKDTFVNHILDRHGPNSSFANKSHFNLDFDILDGIENTLRGENFFVKSNTQGRPGYIFEQIFNTPIGTKANGKLLYTIKVVIDSLGNVITAFPK